MRPRFARRIAAITASGLAVRLVYVLGFRRDDPPWGDGFFYHHGANLLAHGHGFIEPAYYLFFHIRVQAADHPPVYLLFLSLPSVVGLGTALVHMLWSALVGSITVAVTGLVAYRVAGERAGLVAAAIAAIYPNVWIYDGELLSETLAILVATIALLLLYRAWDRSTIRDVCMLGAVCGFATLTRTELALLVPAFVWVLAARAPRGVRLRRAIAGTVVAILVTAPWVVYNLSRFEHPVYISSQLSATLAGANCADTYSGPQLGALTSTCVDNPPLDPRADQSVNARILQARARHFVLRHLSRVPIVVAARVGRVLGVYHPSAQVDLDVALEGRERPLAIAGLLSAYVLEMAAVAGVVVLHRRGRPVYPLLVLPVVALLTVAATYGTNRFRASAETSIVVLAAVAVDAALPTRRQLPTCVDLPVSSPEI